MYCHKFILLVGFPIFGVVLSTALLAENPEKQSQDKGLLGKTANETGKSETEAETKEIPPVSKDASVMIAGTPVPYRVTAGKLALKHDDGKTRAGIFHVSYERTDVKNPAQRPVMFAFNGGPGSSAVWLHIGVLGPKIVRFPGDGTEATPVPSRIEDNPLSILDACDLVFIDPVSTGYSRVEKGVKAEDFHGVQEDISSVAEFIRRWITEHDRWASPKFLLGESYGGVRAAGLADHLQSETGMQINGVILLSTLLDFATLQTAPRNDLPFLAFLPSYAGAALHHGKAKATDPEAFIRESAAFAFGPYATALLKGNTLEDAEKRSIAAKLAVFTGIPAEIWIKRGLRIGPSLFRAELLRAEGKVLGRFDARVAWPAPDPAAELPDYDPSFALAYAAFSTAFMDYLGRVVGYKEERPYEILTDKVQPWKWDSPNAPLNLTSDLADAMRDNPKFRVLVMAGRTDLATPPEGVAHSLRHLPLQPESTKGRIVTSSYAGGHMFYLNPPDLKKCREDLLNFIGP
ncbi:MAG: peptidase S10 [Verrucomicrobiota bacterium]